MPGPDEEPVVPGGGGSGINPDLRRPRPRPDDRDDWWPHPGPWRPSIWGPWGPHSFHGPWIHPWHHTSIIHTGTFHSWGPSHWGPHPWIHGGGSIWGPHIGGSWRHHWGPHPWGPSIGKAVVSHAVPVTYVASPSFYTH